MTFEDYARRARQEMARGGEATESRAAKLERDGADQVDHARQFIVLLLLP